MHAHLQVMNEKYSDHGYRKYASLPVELDATASRFIVVSFSSNDVPFSQDIPLGRRSYIKPLFPPNVCLLYHAALILVKSCTFLPNGIARHRPLHEQDIFSQTYNSYIYYVNQGVFFLH